MIIAWPLEDIRTFAGSRRKEEEHPAEQRRGKKKVVIQDHRKFYQFKGVPTKVVVFMDNVAILEDKNGNRFPSNINRLIWAEVHAKGP